MQNTGLRFDFLYAVLESSRKMRAQDGTKINEY